MKRQKAASKRHVLLHETDHSSCQHSFTRRTSPAPDARSRAARAPMLRLPFLIFHARVTRAVNITLRGARRSFLHHRDVPARVRDRTAKFISPRSPPSPSRRAYDRIFLRDRAVRCLLHEKFIPLIFTASIGRPAHVPGPFINFSRRCPRNVKFKRNDDAKLTLFVPLAIFATYETAWAFSVRQPANQPVCQPTNQPASSPYAGRMQGG